MYYSSVHFKATYNAVTPEFSFPAESAAEFERWCTGEGRLGGLQKSEE